MRDWQIRSDQLVLHGTDKEIPDQSAVNFPEFPESCP